LPGFDFLPDLPVVLQESIMVARLPVSTPALLTLALSPSAGERGKPRMHMARRSFFLSPAEGERARVRGLLVVLSRCSLAPHRRVSLAVRLAGHSLLDQSRPDENLRRLFGIDIPIDHLAPTNLQSVKGHSFLDQHRARLSVPV